jgi:hypothetical protein
LARFVKAVRIDNSKIKVEKILIDCREATGEFNNFYKILSKQEMQQLLDKKIRNNAGGKTALMDHLLHVPVRLEKAGLEICRINHLLEGAASGREWQKDALELNLWSIREGRLRIALVKAKNHHDPQAGIMPKG